MKFIKMLTPAFRCFLKWASGNQCGGELTFRGKVVASNHKLCSLRLKVALGEIRSLTWPPGISLQCRV